MPGKGSSSSSKGSSSKGSSKGSSATYSTSTSTNSSRSRESTDTHGTAIIIDYTSRSSAVRTTTSPQIATSGTVTAIENRN